MRGLTPDKVVGYDVLIPALVWSLVFWGMHPRTIAGPLDFAYLLAWGCILFWVLGMWWRPVSRAVWAALVLRPIQRMQERGKADV